MSRKFESLNDFYYYYLAEHLDKNCRIFHFIGTSLVLILLVASVVFTDWKLLLFTPVAGYGFAWMGHFFFEKNKPAAFGNPFFSLVSDFRMYFDTISGKLDRKLEEAEKRYPKAS